MQLVTFLLYAVELQIKSADSPSKDSAVIATSHHAMHARPILSEGKKE